MRLTLSFALAAACFGSLPVHAQTPLTVVPTTTLAAETGNNTSTASTFIAQANGNAGAGNVSKLPIRSLLAPGSNTPIFAHFMPWFGTTSHMNVGYNSTNPAQIAAQVSDMLSRGIQGAIVDWYGPNDYQTNTATQNLMAEAQRRNGAFQFAVMYDGGTLAACAASTVTCDVTSQLISDLTYAYNTYENSPAYFRIQGRPVVPFFAVDRFAFYSVARYDIDWNRVSASVPGNPVFIFQNASAYSHPASGGGFSWVMIDTSNPANWGQQYLQGFYSTGQQYPSDATFGATYKGFDDHLAGWGLGRVVSQGCGQTWLNTFSQINAQYPAGNLPFLQLVTWNDYEEGTEIESGIDNCVTVTASLPGSVLTWQVTTGSAQTIDHFRVFVSQDGANLMPLSDVPATATSLSLAGYSLVSGAYTFYVEAIGKPSIRNKMSNAVTLVAGDQPPVAVLNVTPTSGTVPLTVSASLANSSDAEGALASTSIDFGDGAVVSGTSASHTYNKPGTYRVLGTVRDAQGAVSAAGVAVNPTNLPPVVQIGASTAGGAAPVSVNVSTSGSYDPDGSIASMSINFGDGSAPVSATSASHAYSWTGTYTITATATDNLGAVSHASTTVSVQGPQVTIASPSPGASVTSPAHIVASAASGNPISKMTVLLDGAPVYTISGAAVDTTVAMTPGSVHRIDVQTTDSAGASADGQIRVYDQNLPPVAKLSVTPASGTLAVSASTSASYDPDGSVASTSINFGDGATAAGPTASHTYATSGTYTVTATATDNLGTHSSTSQSVTVGGAPVVQSGVTVMTPTATQTVSTDMHVVASATSAYPITAMRIYVDNVSDYAANSNSIDTYVQVSPGTHNVTVQAWDSTGAIFKNTQNVNAVSQVVPQTGWWWDPNLSGTGFFIEYGGKSATGLFVGGYVYDANGNNTWLVSTGPMSGSTYNSTWLKMSGGQTLLGPYKAPAPSTYSNLSITFSDPTHAVMTRPDGTQINLVRFSFSMTSTPAPPEAGTPQNGWWWGGMSLSGTGYGIEIQGNAVFIVAYVYDDAGNPVWYLATGNLTTPMQYSGTWDMYANGPQLTSPEATYHATKTGSASPMSLTFSDATHGTLTMGSISIPITRLQEF
jgi:PKD repeat protein